MVRTYRLLTPSLVLILFAGRVGAETFYESGDAGQLPELAQELASIGRVDAIVGRIENAFDAELFQLAIDSPAEFSATASQVGTTAPDLQLFLFDSAGRGVVADDNWQYSSLPRLPVGSLPGRPAGAYYLGVSPADIDPWGISGEIFPDVEMGISVPGGLSPMNPVLGWSLDFRAAGGNYAILLTGVVGTIAPTAGDYNVNGVVDAADYTVWRDTLGSTTDLRANGDDSGASAGVIDGADYLAWKSQFGMTADSGAGAVPEPKSVVLLLMVCASAVCWRPHIGRRWHLVAASTLVCALPAGANCATVTYSAAADFSVAENPHGVWRYGWYTSPTAEFHLYPTSAVDGILKGWYDPPITVLGAPAVFRNSSSETYAAGTVSILGAQLAFHPGNLGQFSVVRWTAPQSGQINIAAVFTGRDLWGTTTDVHVLHNGDSLFVGSVNGFATGPAPFETTRNVLEGDIIDFAVGYGNGSFFNDTTSVHGVIVNDTALPMGDYNLNGVVDAADYTIWRDTLGSTTDLRANGDDSGASAGVIDGADYLAWKLRFSESAGSGAIVPEPGALLLAVMAGGLALAFCSRTTEEIAKMKTGFLQNSGGATCVGS